MLCLGYPETGDMAAGGVEFHPKIGVFCVIGVSCVVLKSDSVMGSHVAPDQVTKNMQT